MKLFFKTFGCQSNEYDSFRVYDFLKRFFKCTVVYSVINADIIFINLCSVRQKVEKKSLDYVKKIFLLKKKDSNKIIVCFGCITLEKLLLRYVDIFFSIKALYKLPLLLFNFVKKNKLYISNNKVHYNEDEIENLYFPKYFYPKNFVYIPISDGCSNFCTYCSVPFLRGQEVCRLARDIIVDFKYYLFSGTKEFIFLGHNVNSYLDKTINISFVDLLKKILCLAKTNLYRFKFLTANPRDFSFDLCKLYGDFSNLSSHLHLPIQSGSNKILSRMKRGYTYEDYKEIFINLKKFRKNLSVTTDFIVGFPGESNNDFMKTLKSVEDFSFDTSFCFMYSSRFKTIAKNYFLDDNNFEVKLKRLRILQNTLLKSVKINTLKLLDKRKVVLVFGVLQEGIYWGKTVCNKTVLFQSSLKTLFRCFVVVLILTYNNYTLLAKFLYVLNGIYDDFSSHES